MKRIIIFFFLLCSFSLVNAQIRQGRTQNVRPETNNTKPPEFKPRKFAGIVTYDTEKVLKKVGVKKSNENYSKISSILKGFNKDMNDFSRLNTFTFNNVKSNVDAAQKQSVKSQDYSSLREAYSSASKALAPIIKQVIEKENTLNEKLKPLFSKKQFSKWVKYKLKLKKRAR